MRPIIFLLVALVIIGADQISKWYVMEHVLRPQIAGDEWIPPDLAAWYQAAPERIEPIELVVLPNFNLVSVWNKGISFGMFNQTSDSGPMILVGLAIAISLVFGIWLFRTQDKIQAAGIILVIGGALGNVIDRLRFGAVFDFLDFHAFDYHWPAFNIADSGIVLGVAILIVHSFFFDKKHQG